MTQDLSKTLNQKLETLGSLRGPDTRFQALHGLFIAAIEGLRSTSIAFILQDIPEDKDDWKELYGQLDHHIGLQISRTKIIGTAANILKLMGDLYKKELREWELKVQSNSAEISKTDDMDELAETIRNSEKQLAAVAVGDKPIEEAEVQW